MSCNYIHILINTHILCHLTSHKGSHTGVSNRAIAGGRGVYFQCPVRCFYLSFMPWVKCNLAVTCIVIVTGSTEHFLRNLSAVCFPLNQTFQDDRSKRSHIHQMLRAACWAKKPAQVGSRVPPSGPGQAEKPQRSSQEQAQGQPSMRETHCSASHFWWYLQRTCPHYSIRIRSLQSQTGWELQWYFRPPLSKHTPALLKRSAVRVLYGKKYVKQGPKVSPECTQFGCLNLLIIVTITQIVIWECLLTIRQNCRQTSQAWSWREEFKWDV